MGQIIYPKRDYLTTGKIAYPSRKNTVGLILYSDLIAGWEFGVNTGTIGTDVKGFYNASSIVNLSKITSSSGIDTQSVKPSHTSGNVVTYANIPYNSNLAFNIGDFTICSLVNINAPQVSSIGYLYPVMSRSYPLSSPITESVIVYFYQSLPSRSLSIGFQVGNGGNTILKDLFLTGFPINEWVLCFWEYNYNSDLIKIVYYPKISSSNSTSFTLSNKIGDVNKSLQLMGRNTGSSYYAGDSNFNCQYVYRWNRLLTQDEKDYLWNNGNFTYLPKP